MDSTKITNEFLNMHFGHKITVSEENYYQKNEEAIKHMEHVFWDLEGGKISMWHGSLPMLINW